MSQFHHNESSSLLPVCNLLAGLLHIRTIQELIVHIHVFHPAFLFLLVECKIAQLLSAIYTADFGDNHRDSKHFRI
jgi:hypothetical protein